MNSTLTNDQLIMQQLCMRGPMKATAIGRAIAVSETTVRRLLKQLVEDGTLERTQEGTFTMATKTKKAAEPKAAVNPRGKRPDSAARDEKVFETIKKSKTPLSKADLAEQLGLPVGIAGLSVYRLQHEGRVALQRVEGSRTPVYAVV